MPVKSSRTARVHGIPQTENAASAEEFLRGVIDKAEQGLAYGVDIVSRCDRDDELAALVDFYEGIPEFLSFLRNNPLGLLPIATDDQKNILSFDFHFNGFTQLSPLRSPSQIQADIVAIGGIDGHAYGSWQGKAPLPRPPMWLRDFLSIDLATSRILTYGYDAKLSAWNATKAEDYTTGFLEDLRNIRRGEISTRPLILVTHSFGGIIAARALIKACYSDSDHEMSALYRATCGIMFFAVPHRGIDVDDMIKALNKEDRPISAILERINIKSQTLETQLIDFRNVLKDRKVVSFYESERTKRLEKDKESGDWRRTGPPVLSLASESAVLSLPSDIETSMSLPGDHSTIVKFVVNGQTGYTRARGLLMQFLEHGQKVVPARFSQGHQSPMLTLHHSYQGLGGTIGPLMSSHSLSRSRTPNSSKRSPLQHDDAGEPPPPKRTKGEANKPFDAECLKELLGLLAFDQLDERQSNIEPAHKNTCQWLLHHQVYKQWHTGQALEEHHGFLWIKGNPGSGKSTLMKFAVQQARQGTEFQHCVVLAFFFNARGTDLEKSVIGAYRTLLHQLLKETNTAHLDQTSLDELKKQISKMAETTQWDIDNLKYLFKQALQSMDRPLICFIDALDESDEIEIGDMVDFLQDMCEDSLALKGHVRFCVASRHYPNIESRWSCDMILDDEVGHAQDIETYLRSKLGLRKSKFREEVLTRLSQKAHGIFMWVVLVVADLRPMTSKGYDMNRIREKINQIPEDLFRLFEDILQRNSSENETTLICYQWILFAKRPLTPQELYYAVACGSDDSPPQRHDPDVVDDEIIRLFILNHSKGLAEQTSSRKKSTVQFIHESVKDFLLKGGLSKLNQDLVSRAPERSHLMLMQYCRAHLQPDISSFDIFRDNLPKANTQEAKRLREEIADTYPFLKYAVTHVLYHADQAFAIQATNADPVTALGGVSYNQWRQLAIIFEQYETRRYNQHQSFLQVLAREGHRNLTVQALRSPLANKQGEDDCYEALGAAIEADQQDLVVLLVDYLGLLEEHSTQDKADRFTRLGASLVAAMDKRKEGCVQLVLNAEILALRPHLAARLLCKAASHGLIGTVEWLLELGVSTEVSYLGMLPMYWACQQGQEQVIGVLLRKGADINALSPSSQIMTSLNMAWTNGQLSMVTYLKSKGAVMGPYDPGKEYWLQRCSFKGHFGLLKLLLEQIADIDMSEAKGQSLLAASREGRAEIVKLLLEHGADVHTTDERQNTALHKATTEGCNEVIKLLLAKGADTEARDNLGCSALHCACYCNRPKTARLLLDEGADPESRDGHGCTPLYRAVEEGNIALVELLLDKGADLESRDGHGCTPLYRAVEKGNIASVKLLLDKGADLESRDGHGCTPLYRAVEKGNIALVELLLEHKADRKARSHGGKTALEIARNAANWKIVVLLQHGHEMTREERLCFMEAAVRTGFCDKLNMALEAHKISPLFTESDLDVALALAAQQGQDSMVAGLLKAGANIDAEVENETALIGTVLGRFDGIYLAHGRVQTVKLLTAQGADLFFRAKSGTALEIAVERGWQPIIDVLLHHGADLKPGDQSPHLKCLDGNCPYKYVP